MGKGVKAGDAHVKMHMDGKGIGASVSAIGGKFSKLAALAGPAAAALTGIGAAATAVVVKFTAAGDAMDKMSKRTGMSVETLSQLKFATEQSGSNLETFEAALRGLVNNIASLGSGSTEAAATFKKLGLTFSDLAKLTPEEQFTLIGERIADIKNPTDQAAVAMKLFGEQGSLLLPLLTSDIKGLKEEADALGLTMSTTNAKAAADLSDAWNRLKSTAGSFAMALGATIAPVLTRILDLFTRILGKARQWTRIRREVTDLAGEKVAAMRNTDPRQWTGLTPEETLEKFPLAGGPRSEGRVSNADLLKHIVIKDIGADRYRDHNLFKFLESPPLQWLKKMPLGEAPQWSEREFSKGGFGQFFDPGGGGAKLQQLAKDQLKELEQLNENFANAVFDNDLIGDFAE